MLLWAESRPVWAVSCDGQGLTLLCGPCSVGIPWLASDTLLFRHDDLVRASKRNEASQTAWPASVGPLLLALADSTASLSTAENAARGRHTPCGQIQPSAAPGLLSSASGAHSHQPHHPAPGHTASPGLLSRTAGR